MRQAPIQASDKSPPSLFDQAVRLHELGELARADHVYGLIGHGHPRYFQALHLRGLLRCQQGRNEDALPFLEAALAGRPGDAAAWSNLGVAQARLGRLEQALASYDQALALKPAFAEALVNRGDALRRLGRAAEALASYDQALALAPDQVGILAGRAAALLDLGRDDEAVASFDQVLARQPDHAEALGRRGDALGRLGRAVEALASYDRALAVQPGNPEMLNNRANVLLALARPADALASFERAVAARPDFAEALNGRGHALLDLARPEEALASFERALALRPDYAEALNNSGVALMELGRSEDALECFARAVAAKPDYAVAHDNKGVILTELGRFPEAEAALETAIALAPRAARQYFDLALLPRRWRADDPHLLAMEELARDAAALPPDEQVKLHFALAKAYAGSQLPEQAFRRLAAGNALKRRQLAYDEAATLAALDTMRTGWTAELMRRQAGQGEPSAVPVFILGMPRSGTSLVEQILASHPAVFGAGELGDILAVAAEPGGALTAEALLHLPDEALRRFGQRYVDRVAARAPAAMRITDKTPGNFRLAGLIHLALPNARIIHTRRDPIDTCLSCFAQLFVGGNLPYVYDLGELGRYYRGYAGLMDHWRSVLPPGAMLELQYEAVVADLETEARRIVAYCGLDWDPRCLDFHRTQRPVRTASVSQVRQPIYRSSVGRWRAYRPYLQPLLDALGPLAGGDGVGT